MGNSCPKDTEQTFSLWWSACGPRAQCGAVDSSGDMKDKINSWRKMELEVKAKKRSRWTLQG